MALYVLSDRHISIYSILLGLIREWKFIVCYMKYMNNNVAPMQAPMPSYLIVECSMYIYEVNV